MIWILWIEEVVKLQKAFSRKKTFYWAILTLMGMTINVEPAGVTSFIRCILLNPYYYPRMLALFHSSSINLETLTKLWCKNCISVLKNFLVTVNDRYVFAIDGIHAPKEGRRMPGVKSIYQTSENNSKPTYIMGHSCQMLGVIAKTLSGYVLVPLVMRIFGGIKNNQGEIENTYDCAFYLMKFLILEKPAYILSDAYYAVKKIFDYTVSQKNDIICKIKINAVGYLDPLPTTDQTRRGRPRLYGEKVILRNYFQTLDKFRDTEVYIYGKKEKVKILSLVLIMKSLKRKVQYCLVASPSGKKIILVSTDLNISPEQIIEAYALRFKIENCFRQFVHTLNGFMYRFWSKYSDKIKRKSPAQTICNKNQIEQKSILNKIRAYQIFLQLAVIAQGLIRCLAILKTEYIFANSNVWLRTQRRDRVPSDMIVQAILKKSFPEFCGSSDFEPAFMKFLKNKQQKPNPPPG